MELEIAPAKEKLESDQREKVPEGERRNENEYDKRAPVSGDITRKEVQEGSLKTEEDEMKKEVAKPVSGKEGEQHSSEEMMRGQKQEETDPVDDK